jgi:SWI/SNF-related matrix-associated actin-dependent regulator 1 of chromatin subfamily A
VPIRPDLYSFQSTGRDFFVALKVALLADDMGLGESYQSIAAADVIKALMILVVGPAISLDTWAREWATKQQIDRQIHIIRSAAGATHVFAAIKNDGSSPGHVLIVSYALISKILPLLRTLLFDVLIADESQALKNPRAVRTRSFYDKDNGLIHRAKRVWLLTGTPMPNGPHEIWPAYWSLFNGKLAYAPFVNRYCLTAETPYNQQVVGSNRQHTPELAAHLRPFILRRRWQDVLPHLPPLSFDYIPVFATNMPVLPDMSIEMQAVLGKLDRGQALSVIDQTHLATLRRLTAVAKIPIVLELAQAELGAGLEKLIIFAHLRTIAKLSARLPKASGRLLE